MKECHLISILLCALVGSEVEDVVYTRFGIRSKNKCRVLDLGGQLECAFLIGIQNNLSNCIEDTPKMYCLRSAYQSFQLLYSSFSDFGLSEQTKRKKKVELTNVIL